MAESPRAVDLRLTVPADAPYREMAAELATKFAEYAGADKHAAAAFGESVGRVAQGVANGRDPIEFEMARRPVLVTVRATSGTRHDETTCPLPE
jgi:hypothetical protein